MRKGNKKQLITRGLTYLVLILFFLLFQSKNCSAQAWQQSRFKHYGLSEGLNSLNVSCIHRDKSGFLWVGTDNGLNRFDGYRFISFRHQISDTNSLSNNRIGYIHEDDKGHLWLATWKFLCEYNPETGKFITHKYEVPQGTELEARVNYILPWSEDTLLLGTNQGIAFYRKSSSGFTFYNLQKKGFSRESNYVFGLARLDKYSVLVSGFEDLFVLNLINGNLKKLSHRGPALQKNYAHVTGKIIKNGESDWLISTWNGDYITYHYGDSVYYHQYFTHPYTDAEYGGGAISFAKKNNFILFATNGSGIYVLDKTKGLYQQIKNEPGNSASLSSDFLNTIYYDYEGILWVGSDKGLDKFDERMQLFELISYKLFNPHSGEPDRAFSMFFDSYDRTFYTGTWGAYIQEKNGRINFLNDEPEIKLNKIKGSPFYLKDSLICWPRSEGFQLFYSNPVNSKKFYRQLREFKVLPAGPIPNDVLMVGNDIYVVFESDGVFVLKNQKEPAQHIEIKDEQNKLLKPERFNFLSPVKGEKDQFWLGTSPFGLFKLNLKTGVALKENIPIIPPGEVINLTQIIEDKNGNYWCATEFQGLLNYQVKQKKWIQWEDKKGISFSHIRRIEIVKDSFLVVAGVNYLVLLQLWDNGLIRLGPADGMSFGSMPFSFCFNENSLLISCEEGTLKADMHRILQKYSPGKIIFTSLTTDNETVQYLNIDEGSLALKWPQNSLHITFSLMSLYKTEQHFYQYRFDEGDTVWKNLGNSHELILHNLPYGSYKLQVRALSSQGILSTNIASMLITIEAPVYRQTWFVFLVLMILGGLSFFIYRLYIQRKLAVLKTRDAIARDLHDEVGSVLTSISYLSEMGKIQSQSDKGLFDKIGETSRKVAGLMSDIIWAVNPDKDKAVSLIQRMQYHINESAVPEKCLIKLEFSSLLQHQSFTMEERKGIFLIFKEALHNSVKYSEATEIMVNFYKDGLRLVLELRDNGKGFDVNNHHKGNGLTNLKKRAMDLKGELEVESRISYGTCVRLILVHHNWG